MPRVRGNLHGGRRIGVLHEDVGALVGQRLGGVGFLARVEPGVHPDHLELDVGIDGLRAEHGRIDAGNHLRDRERGDVTEHALLRHLAGDHALDVAAFVEAAGIGAHVGRALEAGGMLEHDLGKLLRDFERRVHVAERGGEDQLVAGARQLRDRALGIRALADVLEIGGLDLVAQRLHHLLAADFVPVGPAKIADRPQVDKSDLQFIGGGRAVACRGDRQSGDRGGHQKFSHGFDSGLTDG